MVQQLHKKFIDEEVKSIFEKYLSKEIELEHALQIFLVYEY